MAIGNNHHQRLDKTQNSKGALFRNVRSNWCCLPTAPPLLSSGKVFASRVGNTGIVPLPLSWLSYSSDLETGNLGLPSQAPGVIGSVPQMAGSVSIHSDGM